MQIITTLITAPQNELETELSRYWQNLLKIDNVSVEVNFFELGGNSLLLTQLTEQIQHYYDSSFAMTDIFKYPTIRLISQYIKEGKKEIGGRKGLAQERARKARELISRRK